MTSELPWVSEGPSARVGVCLSGGGLRAASFAYGAVQGLQATRGLLYGERCADFLAVVSGGSYLAAALTLNSIPPVAPGGASPLACKSSEATYVSSHGTYFKHVRVIMKIVVFLVVNLLAFASLFYFVGLALAMAAEVEGVDPPLKDTVGLYAVAGVALFGGGFLWLRGLYWVGERRRFVAALGVFIMAAGAPSIVATMHRIAGGWTWLAVAGVAFGLFVLSGAVFRLGMRWGDSDLWRPVGWLGARIPALAGLALLCITTSELAGALDYGDGIELDEALLSGTLLLGGAASWIAGRVSLHRLYRERLATCFSVRRADGDDVTQIGDTDQRISEMRPPPRGEPGSCPRLLVCATANVIWRRRHPPFLPANSDPWRKRRYASFVYSHDRCGIPEAPGASFDTVDLERLTTHASVRRDREPLVRLMTAIASTGAAASPAMGRKTSSFLRTTCALTNVRLGRWLPNPMSETVRKEVKDPNGDALMRRHLVLGSGFNEFVPELFGLHRTDAPRVYISDGGHYDNLGLIALLHAGCQEIWCVDAQADPTGNASQLRNTLRFAESEVGVIADQAPLDELQNGSGHAILELTYPDGQQTATLVVINLGLTTPKLKALAAKLADNRFPHHNTFWPPSVMWYETPRFRAYGEVGYENARAAAGDPRLPASP